MRRLIEEELLQWKRNDNRKPLLLYGARQVGKTYIIRKFAEEHYGNYIYVNFERMPMVATYFDGDLNPARLIRCLEEYFTEKVTPDRTLIIFDEIQACERALTSLKYFCEEAPEYHIVSAGSLLGVAVNREKYSFPVGKIDIKTLYPFRFDEFLMATGNDFLLKAIRDAYESSEALSEEFHREALEWYYKYLFVGGMPAAIKEYISGNSLVDVSDIQHMILDSYTADMAKYTSEQDSAKIRHAYRSMPAQLAKDNKKFQYKLIRKGATAGLFGDSIDWLVTAGLVYECNKTTRGEIPLTAHRDVSSFKLYLSDVGLLTAFSNIMPENIMRKELSDVYRGALAENFVAQTLVAGGHELYYWTSDSPISELDFVIQIKGKVYPMEVKSGENFHSKSLKHFNNMYHPERIYHISERNYGYADGVYSLPIYMVFCL